MKFNGSERLLIKQLSKAWMSEIFKIESADKTVINESGIYSKFGHEIISNSFPDEQFSKLSKHTRLLLFS